MLVSLLHCIVLRSILVIVLACDCLLGLVHGGLLPVGMVFGHANRKLCKLVSLVLRIVRGILGVVLAFGCLSGIVLGGWSLVRRFSGMLSVKVHEWCLVCYGWLALCLRNNFHLAYLLSYVLRLVSPELYCGFSVLYT